MIDFAVTIMKQVVAQTKSTADWMESRFSPSTRYIDLSTGDLHLLNESTAQINAMMCSLGLGTIDGEPNEDLLPTFSADATVEQMVSAFRARQTFQQVSFGEFLVA